MSSSCVMAKLTVIMEKMNKTALVSVHHLIQVQITVRQNVTQRTVYAMNCSSSAHLEDAFIVLKSAMDLLTA